MQAEVDGVQGQLRGILAKNLNRMIDTFREFDVDKSGSVDRKEFCRALVRLGVTARQAALDATFRTFDMECVPRPPCEPLIATGKTRHQACA